jgi:hypothetical protein
MQKYSVQRALKNFWWWLAQVSDFRACWRCRSAAYASAGLGPNLESRLFVLHEQLSNAIIPSSRHPLTPELLQ